MNSAIVSYNFGGNCNALPDRRPVGVSLRELAVDYADEHGSGVVSKTACQYERIGV